jgi:hypothetical protein
VAFLEDSKKRQQAAVDPSGLKGERFVGEERSIITKGEKVQSDLKALSRSLSTDKLITMVKESGGIRERNVEAMIQAGEEQSEIHLAKHIKEQLAKRNVGIRERRADDYIVDWVLMGTLVVVAIVGLLMWRKVKEQQSLLM